MDSKSQSGLAGAVKLVVTTFMEQSHYQKLHAFLSEEWSHCHSLYAAVRLMEAHGVYIAPEKEEMYANMPEDRMIDVLVQLMPQQNREQFEHFFLQLSLVASTTSRLRAALESGQSDAVEEVLESAQNVGILPFILKMAVAQAGGEVKSHDKDHNDWLAMVADRMAPLLQSQANALISEKALVDARAQLAGHHSEANEKSKRVLMALSSGQADVLIHSCFSGWAERVREQKHENEIRKEYEEEIEAAEKKLQDYILSQTSIMRNMLNKRHGETIETLKAACFQALLGEIEEKKERLRKEAEMDELNAKMAAFTADQSAKSKKVLSRMSAGSDEGLKTMYFTAWVQFIAEYNKNKEFEDAVKAEEQKIAEFMKSHNDGAKSVLNRMSSATEQGLVSTCFKGWVDAYEEIKKANELQELLNSGSGRFKEFSKRNGSSAKNAMDRAAELQDINTMIVIFSYWKREAKVERMRRYAKDKNIKKKNQLIGVKGLFRNFANELESGLKEGTPRATGTALKKSDRGTDRGSPGAV